MHIKRFTDAALCYEEMLPYLVKEEAINNLCIGILHSGMHDLASANWFMAAVIDDAGIPLVFALQTPPHNIILTPITKKTSALEQAIASLVQEMKAQKLAVPGVIGVDKAAALFFAAWMGHSYGAQHVSFQQGIYMLEQVLPVPLVGKFRMATMQDLYFLPYWLHAMKSESGIMLAGFDSTVDRAKELIAAGNMGILLDEEGTPVSMAALARQLPHGYAVSHVYSPPYYRNKGYATSCVAQLSAHALSGENTFCVLHTDLSNPTSNAIYKKIGYVQVATMLELAF